MDLSGRSELEQRESELNSVKRALAQREADSDAINEVPSPCHVYTHLYTHVYAHVYTHLYIHLYTHAHRNLFASVD